MTRALLLTVGTGSRDDLEGSLLSPLRKSIAKGEWERVVLLPSSVTRDASEKLAAEQLFPGLEIRPLPKPGSENDADVCFRHFEAEIERLRRDGFAQRDILVDFTRGTKAMSAALVLAAVAHELPHMRYITGSRDSRGMVVGGSEELRETSPSQALALRRLDGARHLVERASFGAALEVLPDPDKPFTVLQLPRPLEDLQAVRQMTCFLSAWDRLSYGDAKELGCPVLSALPAAWRPLCPSPAMQSWVGKLARAPSRDEHTAMAAWLRLLAVDLLANAERRRQQRQLEDALVRSYRVLELVGQSRLFSRGIDSERIPPEHEVVKRTRERIRKSKSSDFSLRGDGFLMAARETAARLLKEFGDPLAPELLAFAGRGEALKAKNRNSSILIHGFEARAPSDESEWDKLFKDLWDLLERDWADAPGDFTQARDAACYP